MTEDEQPVRAALDLEPAAIGQYWRHQGVAAAVAAMERVESWTLDGQPVAEEVVAMLARRLNEMSDAQVAARVAGASGAALELMAFMRSGRALALFKWLADVDASVAPQLLRCAQASGSEAAGLLLERITALDRQHLLSRVMSPWRIAQLCELLEEAGLADPGEPGGA